MNGFLSSFVYGVVISVVFFPLVCISTVGFIARLLFSAAVYGWTDLGDKFAIYITERKELEDKEDAIL